MTTVITTNPNTRVDSGTVTVVKKGTGLIVIVVIAVIVIGLVLMLSIIRQG